MMREQCAMSRHNTPWKEVLQDLFAVACMLVAFAGLTLFCVALVPT